jgi:hypothetical protein
VSDLFEHGDLGVSLYPMLYTSSKGEVMRIDDTTKMNDFRLVTVYNKLAAQDEREGAVGQLFEAFFAEITRRGLDPQFRGGRPPIEKPPCDEGWA